MANMNRLMVNNLMSCKELCTAANGFQIKLAISRIEDWMDHKTLKAYVGNAGKKLKMLSECATVLTLDKSVLVNDDAVIPRVCATLNLHQIKQLVVSFHPDALVTDTVPTDVINTITQRCKAIGAGPILIGEENIKPLNPQKLFVATIRE